MIPLTASLLSEDLKNSRPVAGLGVIQRIVAVPLEGTYEHKWCRHSAINLFTSGVPVALVVLDLSAAFDTTDHPSPPWYGVYKSALTTFTSYSSDCCCKNWLIISKHKTSDSILYREETQIYVHLTENIFSLVQSARVTRLTAYF